MLSARLSIRPSWPNTYDTAKYISDALGQRTIRFETASRSQHSAWRLKPGTFSAATGEHIHGRSLLTPDEIMRLGGPRPADRHDRRRAALAPRPHQLPHRPRLCRPLRSQPDTPPRRLAMTASLPVEMAIEQPAWGQVRVSEALKRYVDEGTMQRAT
jgi:hypothetical protein